MRNENQAALSTRPGPDYYDRRHSVVLAFRVLRGSARGEGPGGSAGFSDNSPCSALPICGRATVPPRLANKDGKMGRSPSRDAKGQSQGRDRGGDVRPRKV